MVQRSTYIIIFRPNSSACRQSTKILPQRYHTVHILCRKEVKRKVPRNAIQVSMDLTSLNTNIPQEEGINTVYRAYEAFYKNDTPIPTNSLRGLLRLILQENSFQFNGRNSWYCNDNKSSSIFCQHLYVRGKNRNYQ